MKQSAQIKRQLFLRTRQEVADRLGRQDTEIRKSAKGMQSLFSRPFRLVSQKQFEQNLKAAEWIFWGDFHGVRQSQRSFINQIKKQYQSGDKLCLALECLPLTAQKWIDVYIAGEMTEKEFLEKSKWHKVWGFPWEHYQPIFDWAKEKKVKILALNSQKPKAKIAERERLALKLMKNYQKKNHVDKIWILYGEFHLLPTHFPKKLSVADKKRSVFVFQNSDTLYFRKPPQNLKEGEIYKTTGPYYCVQNVPPWVKWQTYLLFLELKEDYEVDEEIEVTEHVLKLARILAEELGFKIDENALDIYTGGERALWDYVKSESGDLRHLFESFMEEGISFANSTKGWAFLSRVSVNEAAFTAFQVLLFQQNPGLTWPDQRLLVLKDWEHLIWILGFSYFGSKLINPHRMTPSLTDLQRKVKASQHPIERQAARLALAYELRRSLGTSQDPFRMTTSDRIRFLSLKWLAGLMGEKLYSAFNQKRLKPEHLRVFMTKNPSQNNFHIVMDELNEMIGE